MKFLIQQNLMNKPQLEEVAKATEKYPRSVCDVVPFTREITAYPEIEGTDYIPYGSTLLITIGQHLGFTGQHFDVKKMNYRHFIENRSDMLNDMVMTVQDARNFLSGSDPCSKWFTRPSEDLKQYSGIVMEAGEIVPWFTSMMEAVGGGSYYMDPKTEVVLSTPKDISAEWRWFIVGGKIVSGSLYRAHGQLRKIRELDVPVIEEAQALADIWLPHPCVVMDTALVDGKMKVVEFNCINGSGFYANDIPAVFDALWEYHQ